MFAPSASKQSALILPEYLKQERDTIWTPKKDLLFRIGKYKDFAINDPICLDFKIGNYIQVEIVNSIDGRTRWKSPEFHNNITNVGMDMCATDRARADCCQVGSGSAAVADTNTTLQTWVAGCPWNVAGGGGTDISHVNSGAPLYYWESYRRWDFLAGQVVGNISEIGFGPAVTNGSQLFCRELIRDEAGLPTTITLQSHETLRVYYRFRLYPPVVDATGTINGTINGSPVTRNFTRRALGVTSTGFWSARYGTSSSHGWLFGSIGYVYISTTGLQAITGTSLSGFAQAATATTNSYTPGSYTRSGQVSFPPTAANQANKTIVWTCCTIGSTSLENNRFQCELDTAITKTNLQTLTLSFQTSWSRYTP